MPERYIIPKSDEPKFIPNPNGRPKGSPNKISGLLREAALIAGEQIGEPQWVFKKVKTVATDKRTGKTRVVEKVMRVLEGTGVDGVIGFFRWAYLNEPVAMIGLLKAIMPSQVNVDVSGKITAEASSLAGVDLTKLSVEELQAKYRDLMSQSPGPPPKLIEHVPAENK